MSKRHVAILGCGPAGLLAAHAARLRGCRITVYSNIVEPSRIPGTMYLHREIPELDLDPVTIDYIKMGSREGYARKVYGSPNAPCSWDEFQEGPVQGYAFNAMYEGLWQRTEAFIERLKVTPSIMPRIISHHDLVISTIPVSGICCRQAGLPTSTGRFYHMFQSAKIQVSRDPSREAFAVGDPTIVYSGMESHPWYRSSIIAGEIATEYPFKEGGVVADGMQVGVKPLGTNCDCWPEVVRAGRFGKWEKGVLAHHAFEVAEEACHALH